MIAFAIQPDIHRTRFVGPDSERLQEYEVANFDWPVFEPMGKRRAGDLQETCARNDRLPAPDDMLA
jgi:hypothetical protein